MGGSSFQGENREAKGINKTGKDRKERVPGRQNYQSDWG